MSPRETSHFHWSVARLGDDPIESDDDFEEDDEDDDFDDESCPSDVPAFQLSPWNLETGLSRFPARGQ